MSSNPVEGEQKIAAQKSNSNTVELNFQTYIPVYKQNVCIYKLVHKMSYTKVILRK